jgi:hypothetical protein
MSAGGMDFVLIQLEFESPAYSLDWAKKVLAAYPDRRAIISTHGFIDTTGNRTNTVLRTGVGKSANQVWNELIYSNCNIFMVLNGHWHAGDDGEARRTDLNACGKPVHQLLSDYQERNNGGDGWLRYYTFHPDSETIDAYTYSPTLNLFETDADSRFTLSYDMNDATVPVELVAGASSWRWRYAAGVWPTGWSGAGFVDSSWSLGGAPLGFGSTVVTNIDVPAPTSNRPLAALFRREVTVANVAELSNVTVRVVVDDGAVVWLNGVEIGRARMAAGAVSSSTYASGAVRSTVAAADPLVIAVPASMLVNGTNVLAVSTHVNYRSTPDLSFALTMTADRTTG